jgi:hypothetical protein
MVSVSITWKTTKDNRTCPICRAIDGYVFGPYPDVPQELVHPTYGLVWDTQLGSLAHEHQQHRGSKYGLISMCRCHVEAKIDYSDLQALLKKKIEELSGAATEPDDTQSGSKRSTTFEDIGIDPSKYGLE